MIKLLERAHNELTNDMHEKSSLCRKSMAIFQ